MHIHYANSGDIYVYGGTRYVGTGENVFRDCATFGKYSGQYIGACISNEGAWEPMDLDVPLHDCTGTQSKSCCSRWRSMAGIATSATSTLNWK